MTEYWTVDVYQEQRPDGKLVLLHRLLMPLERIPPQGDYLALPLGPEQDESNRLVFRVLRREWNAGAQTLDVHMRVVVGGLLGGGVELGSAGGG